MNTYSKVTFIRNWVGFFILGTINNLPYVIVNSSAKVLATSFGLPNLVGVIPWANVGLNLFAKLFHTFFLLKTPYGLRYLMVTLIMLGGLLGVSFAPSFVFAILCIVIIGGCSGIGENLSLGYLHKFDSRLINAWSSGTGMAGLLGAGIYILFTCIAFETSQNSDENNNSRMKEMNKIAFWGGAPFILLYMISYMFIITRPKLPSHDKFIIQQFDTYPLLNDERYPNDIDVYSDSYNKDILNSMRNSIKITTEKKKYSNRAKSLRKKLSKYFEIYWLAFRATLWLSVNLSSVYFFEYLARVYSAKSRPSSEYNPNCPELYSALQLCYQAGVFVSRSSVQIIKIKHVEIITILQFVNMILWLAADLWKFIPIYLLPMLMVYVGLLGGASYVNIFFIIKSDKKFESFREVAINIASLWIAIGIFTASATSTIFDVTFLKNY